ncbi:MAG: acyl-CoA thioesterase [Acidimicrobiales bacterium]|nr:acyl-CoA thioesterase [Acidimicrobiales bacterium]
MSRHWPFGIDVTIRTFDIDFAGHVSNIVYLEWLEIARTELLEEVGLPIPVILDEGFAPVVARTEIEYRRPLLLGDPVRVNLAVARLRSLSALLEFEVRSGDTVAATARQLGVFVSTATGKPRRLEPEVRDRFLPYVLA